MRLNLSPACPAEDWVDHEAVLEFDGQLGSDDTSEANMAVYGGIEAGGTKFVCAVGTGPDDLRALSEFHTTKPDETLGRAIAWFEEQHAREPLTSLGIASFGPVDLDPESPSYGSITSTPKSGWAGTDVRGRIGSALRIPVGFDTDVNGAALGEHRWGAAQDVSTFVYLTIGTGIGGGGLIRGMPIHGLVHPEMGHLRIPHDLRRDPFAGTCPFHGDCLEGLAAGPALEARWGQPGETLPTDHPAWALEADYLALGVTNLILALSPQRVILGGGVMRQRHLFPLIRKRVQDLLAGYLQTPAVLENIDRYIAPPALGDQAGVLGAIALAGALSPPSPSTSRLTEHVR
jgi:fructokinase